MDIYCECNDCIYHHANLCALCSIEITKRATCNRYLSKSKEKQAKRQCDFCSQGKTIR